VTSRAAVTDDQRVGGKPPRRVERDHIGCEREAEGTELLGVKRPGDVDANDEVRQAGKRLICDTPAGLTTCRARFHSDIID
jgi:hypothetical protein